MTRLAPWLARLTFAALAATLIAVAPATTAARPAEKTPEAQAADDARQKQVDAIQKQMADLQKQLEALKTPAAQAPASPSLPAGTLPKNVAEHYTWRNIGPANMGGRVTALAVVESEPATYYVATATGGLLKTVNNGTTFEVLFDKQSTVSIGDVAVHQANPQIVWVGTGEANPRNSASYGDGVYKSTDGGKTFANVGLTKSFQVGKILIHPKNPDIVYVGALGRLYGPSDERGLFKTTDGGKTWAKVLYTDDKTGVIDARLDPNEPDTLLVAMWERKRDEFDGFFGDSPVPDMYGPIVTHGAGGLFKSVDAGKTWKKLTDEALKNGLPSGKLGRIGLDYSRKTKGTLVAIIDTDKVGTGEPTTVYLGITAADTPTGAGAADAPKGGKVGDVTEGGPAEKGGLKAGDLIVKVDATAIERYSDFVDYFVQKNPGDVIQVMVRRQEKDVWKEIVLPITLGKRDPAPAAAPPAPKAGPTPVTGVQLVEKEGVLTIGVLIKDGPAEKAGLKVGDAVVSIDGKKVTAIKEYTGAIADKKPGDIVEVVVKRATAEVTTKVALGAAGRPAAEGSAGQTPTTLPLPGFAPVLGQGPAKVGQVLKGGPAEKAGIKEGDTITKVNGAEIESVRGFLRALRVGPGVEDARKAGAKVRITVKGADDKEKEVEIELVEVAFAPPGANRGTTPGKPYGLGLGGQQPNVQARQGKNGVQTGGIYVSKDNGETWTRVNSLNARPMYFSVVRFDPTDDNTIYALADVPVLYRSTNGGKLFEEVRTSAGVHADAHALWIDPANPRHIIIGCDGGFYVSYDKAATWEHLNTLALGQFYHVAVDNRRPYRVYGGLQDNGTWGGPSHALRRYGPVNEDWVFVSGGDGFVCRVDPTDPDLVYAESQNGFMSRRNFRTGESASIRPPRGQAEEPLRFNWNTPFILSSHNPSIFYCGAQFIYRSVKKGDNLKQISPELTRTKKGSLVAIAESPRTPDVLWAGSDDGFVWVSQDGGAKWTNISENFKAAGLTGPRWCNSIEPSRDKDGRCYVVFDAHRSDDDKPYVFVTEDFGATWKSLNANLPTFGTTRVLREDITNADTLYLGTEFGAWVSINRGASWAKLGSNLPTVPVHEFAQPTVANELVIATHGRSVWVTDITSLRQLKPATLTDSSTLFAPSPAVRWKLGVGGESPYSSTDRRFVGTNPARGATIEYHLGKKADKITLKVVDAAGKVVKAFDKPLATPGIHRQTWDLAGAAARPRTGGRAVGGGQVAAGAYNVVLTIGEETFTQPLLVELDPNAPRDVITIEGVEEGEAALEREREAAEKAPKPGKDD